MDKNRIGGDFVHGGLFVSIPKRHVDAYHDKTLPSG